MQPKNRQLLFRGVRASTIEALLQAYTARVSEHLRERCTRERSLKRDLFLVCRDRWNDY
jgi:hypothetical protein